MGADKLKRNCKVFEMIAEGERWGLGVGGGSCAVAGKSKGRKTIMT